MIDYQTEKEITALLEKEIKNSSEEDNIKSSIENNLEINKELILQSFIKTTTQEKFKFYKIPDNLKEKILRKINSGTIGSPYIPNEHSQKLIIYGSVALIIFGIILVIINLFF